VEDSDYGMHFLSLLPHVVYTVCLYLWRFIQSVDLGSLFIKRFFILAKGDIVRWTT
jgi:hypothetical protein